MKILFVILLSLTLSYAQLPEYLQTQEESVFQLPPQESSDIEEIPTIPIDKTIEKNIVINDDKIENLVQKNINLNYYTEVPFEMQEGAAHNIYAKYVNFPKAIYVPQRVALEVEATVTTSDFTKIETRFLNEKGVSVINPKQVWEKKSENSYKNIYFFKTYEESLQLPILQVVLYKNEKVIDAIFLKAQDVITTKVALEDEQFSNIIARSVQVISAKTRQYNNDELLVVLELEAINGNLEDFRLKEYKEQFLMSLEDEYPKQKLVYNTIVPIHTKELRFNYYNTIANSFTQINVPIKLEEELVSTQTDLNPNDSNLEVYKKIALGSATGFFLVVFIFRRRKIYLIISIIFAISLYTFIKPNDAAIIDKDINIYILPTNKSTVFFITPAKQIVEVLYKKHGFVKVVFKINQNNTTIGWVKEEDVVEN